MVHQIVFLLRQTVTICMFVMAHATAARMWVINRRWRGNACFDEASAGGVTAPRPGIRQSAGTTLDPAGQRKGGHSNVRLEKRTRRGRRPRGCVSACLSCGRWRCRIPRMPGPPPVWRNRRPRPSVRIPLSRARNPCACGARPHPGIGRRRAQRPLTALATSRAGFGCVAPIQTLRTARKRMAVPTTLC